MKSLEFIIIHSDRKVGRLTYVERYLTLWPLSIIWTRATPPSMTSPATCLHPLPRPPTLALPDLIHYLASKPLFSNLKTNFEKFVSFYENTTESKKTCCFLWFILIPNWLQRSKNFIIQIIINNFITVFETVYRFMEIAFTWTLNNEEYTFYQSQHIIKVRKQDPACPCPVQCSLPTFKKFKKLPDLWC